MRSTQTFAGNVAGAGTLATMLTGLNAPPGAWVVMGDGIASAATIGGLRSHRYRYLVVSRERTWQFNPEQAIDIETATGGTVRGSKSPFRRQAGSQFVQIIRRRLKASGINPSWNAIGRIMASQCRDMASFRRADGGYCMPAKPPVLIPGNWLFIAHYLFDYNYPLMASR